MPFIISNTCYFSKFAQHITFDYLGLDYNASVPVLRRFPFYDAHHWRHFWRSVASFC